MNRRTITLPAPPAPLSVEPRLWRNLAAGAAAASLAATPVLAEGPRAVARDMGAKLWLAAGEGGEGG